VNTIDVLEKLFDAVENVLLSAALGIPPTKDELAELERAYKAAEEQ
jgi:hypothetical protein